MLNEDDTPTSDKDVSLTDKYGHSLISFEKENQKVDFENLVQDIKSILNKP
jgi:hypothetical protein